MTVGIKEINKSTLFPEIKIQNCLRVNTHTFMHYRKGKRKGENSKHLVTIDNIKHNARYY